MQKNQVILMPRCCKACNLAGVLSSVMQHLTWCCPLGQGYRRSQHLWYWPPTCRAEPASWLLVHVLPDRQWRRQPGSRTTMCITADVRAFPCPPSAASVQVGVSNWRNGMLRRGRSQGIPSRPMRPPPDLFHKGQLPGSFPEPPGPLVVVPQPQDVVLQRVAAGSCQEAGLPHAPPQHLRGPTPATSEHHGVPLQAH
jgi:hypothetical protein